MRAGLGILAGLLVAGAGAGAWTAQAEVHLLPQPREARFSGEVSVAGGLRVTAPGRDAEDEFAARDLEEAAVAAG